jgi:hypothetical protein
VKRKASGDAASSPSKRTRTVAPVLDSGVNHEEVSTHYYLFPSLISLELVSQMR